MFDEEVSALCLPGPLNLTDLSASVTRWSPGVENDEDMTLENLRETQVQGLIVLDY